MKNEIDNFICKKKINTILKLQNQENKQQESL